MLSITHRINPFLLTGLLSFVHFTITNAACGDLVLSQTVLVASVRTSVVNLPPQFTDVDVICNTNALTLCSPEINVADETIALDTTTAGAYTTINDYNFLRSNKSIFPIFDNELVLTPTFTDINGNNFGVAVAISGDGLTVAIGSLLTQVVDIYQRRNNLWVAIQQLTLPPNIPNNFPSGITIDTFGVFGSALALSYDGSVLAVSGISGANFGNVAMLPRYVFMYSYHSDSNTYLLNQAIAGSGTGGFGQALALSADGKYLVISEDQNNELHTSNNFFIPTAWIYMRSASCSGDCNTSDQWSVQTRLIPLLSDGTMVVSSESQSPAQNVTVSADGTVVALGCTHFNGVSLSIIGVALFNRTGTTWQQSRANASKMK